VRQIIASGNYRIRQLIIAVIVLLATGLSALAGNGQGGNNNNQGGNNNNQGGYSGAPGPVVGAGLPVLAIGYGVYWLVKRRRRTD